MNLRLPGGGRVDARFDDRLAAMAAARDEGLIAGVGLSNVSLEQLRRVVAGTDMVSVSGPCSASIWRPWPAGAPGRARRRRARRGAVPRVLI